MPLSRDTSAVDGFEPFLAVIDEYHAAKTDEMVELIQSVKVTYTNHLYLSSVPQVLT
ncbi:terminase large subunit domain-containing protein [Streptomyces anthocyanicus]